MEEKRKQNQKAQEVVRLGKSLGVQREVTSKKKKKQYPKDSNEKFLVNDMRICFSENRTKLYINEHQLNRDSQTSLVVCFILFWKYSYIYFLK